MANNDTLIQSWNKRSKMWVLIDTSVKGGIKDMSPEKYEGVPVKNGIKSKKQTGTNETEPAETERPGEPEPGQPGEPAQAPAQHKEQDNKPATENSGFFW